MKLDFVQIRDFRNIDELSFTPSEQLNVFLGDNGSGKSSILEAIHYLGFARSFRTAKHKSVIQSGKQEFTVFAQIFAKQVRNKLGFSRSVDDVSLVSVDGVKSKSLVDFVSLLPVQIFTPQSSDLIIGSPKLRRKYLDWLMFHVEPEFATLASLSRRCLLQLNAVYKNRSRGGMHHESRYWAEQLDDYGQKLSDLRNDIMQSEFLDIIHYNLREFLPEFDFDISYYKGWERELSLLESINKNFERDLRNGFVAAGPHKADVRIKSNGVLANELLSRGQLRMLVAALQIAQIEYLQSKFSKSVVFLLDDIGAELDSFKQEIFINKLLSMESQVFVTAIDSRQLTYLSNYENKKLFHVEHGQVREES